MASIAVAAPVNTSPGVADTTTRASPQLCRNKGNNVTQVHHSYTEIIDVSKCIFYI
jgi:hypothetical protein